MEDIWANWGMAGYIPQFVKKKHRGHKKTHKFDRTFWGWGKRELTRNGKWGIIIGLGQIGYWVTLGILEHLAGKGYNC